MAVTSRDTRARILDTAWGLVRERGVGARRHDVRSGFAARAAGAGSLPPVAALERLLRLWFAYLPEILPVARALEAAAVNGDEGGLAWRDRMDDLRELFAAAVDRVAGDGRLAAGWTTTAASDWVWARAQPSTFAHLVIDRAWPAADYTQRAVRSILSEVVSPEA